MRMDVAPSRSYPAPQPYASRPYPPQWPTYAPHGASPQRTGIRPDIRPYVGPALARPRNPYAGTALLAGVASLLITLVAVPLGYYLIGAFGLYALYYGIRGVVSGASLRSYPGLFISLVGMLLSALALLVTLLLGTGLLQVTILS
jgi:hypothetical protein